MLILSNPEVEQVLSMEICMEALEQGFTEYAKGAAVGIPRYDVSVPTSFESIAQGLRVSPADLSRRLPEGQAVLEAMQGSPIYRFKTQVGAVPAMRTLALRLNSDIVAFSRVEGLSRQEKLPLVGRYKYCGLIFLFSTVNGEPLALFPDGQLQRFRVGGTTGLGIKHLARRDASVVGLIGAGWQAGAQVMAAVAARNIKTVRVYSPTSSRRESFARQMSQSIKIEILPVASAREAVEGADIVLGATNSLTPIFDGEWLSPGCHVGAIATPELDEKTYRRAGLIMLTAKSYLELGDRIDYAPPAVEKTIPLRRDSGELKNVLPKIEDVPDLADLLSGRSRGRINDQEITVHMNNSFSLQFAAVGAKVLELARQQRLGRELPTDWFLQDVHT
ncbi:MAG: ornithine cyclodeaminase family protein [Deltaproteobacteria bacterium]|nr:ornithine cyclodeaminase family protein [Deltaproteobacteria bacterium]